MPPFQSQTVTFNKDIAPIIRANCASCHRPGGGAPFSLLTYDDARRRAALIVQATESRYMPPWKPEPGFGAFAGERRLPDAQRVLIQQWVAAGVPEGDRKEMPDAPQPAAEWQLGTPDLVIAMPEPYQLRADGSDVFRTFVIPVPLARGRYVRGLELRPGNGSTVHHATIKIDRTRASRQLDEEEGGPGYDGGGARSATFPDGHFLGWTPGDVPSMLPVGMGWHLEADSALVLELHMMPTGKEESVQPRVGLFFGDQAPSRRSFIVRLGSQSIDIAAGDRAYTVTDSFVLPVASTREMRQRLEFYSLKFLAGVSIVRPQDQ
jgi:hypothetical protein